MLAKNAAIGFGVAAALVAALIWTDTAQLGTLVFGSPVGWLAAALLFFFVGLTFASVQMGIAVMTMNRDQDGPRQKPRVRRVAALAPVRVRTDRRVS